MKLAIDFEYELTKEINYHLDSIEPIEEYVFIVPGEWFHDLYNNYIVEKFCYYDVPIEKFLDAYDPEVEGEAIYILAKSQGVIKEEGWAQVVQDL